MSLSLRECDQGPSCQARNRCNRVMYALTGSAYITAQGGAAHEPRRRNRVDRTHPGVCAHPRRMWRFGWRGRGSRRQADPDRVGDGHGGGKARRRREGVREVALQHQGQDHTDRLGRGPSEAGRRCRRREAARRDADGRELSGRVRRHGCPGAGRHEDLPRGRLLPCRLAAGLLRRQDLRRPLVRRHPRALLPHRPRRQGRHQEGPGHHGRTPERRRGLPEEGRHQVGPVHPAGRTRHRTELLPVPVLHAAAPSSTTTARPS